jgi:hypothetical protein
LALRREAVFEVRKLAASKLACALQGGSKEDVSKLADLNN